MRPSVGGAALLLGSLRLALGVAHPYLEYAAAIRLPPGLGTLQCPQSGGGSPATHDCLRLTHLSDGAAPELSEAALCASKAYGQGLWSWIFPPSRVSPLPAE